jgi:hypothetical protein
MKIAIRDDNGVVVWLSFEQLNELLESRRQKFVVDHDPMREAPCSVPSAHQS